MKEDLNKCKNHKFMKMAAKSRIMICIILKFGKICGLNMIQVEVFSQQQSQIILPNKKRPIGNIRNQLVEETAF